MHTDVRDSDTYAVIGAAMEVHRTLGQGFLENVYQEALAIELTRQNIPFKREVALPISYKGILLPCAYRVDYLCYDNLLIELKALASLSNNEEAQVINYLRASQHKKALLLNIGAYSLQHKRFVL
ncbi:GxxExxY protein [Asticcacaulis taihuensis]|uniref:GxxExxY protein n=1 Tax=Asticcacaulis taihuensis TaxID=260084 RepID=UPI0026F040DB|nr:GxxExxY protein [Asticcacaulis taihuensis]